MKQRDIGHGAALEHLDEVIKNLGMCFFERPDRLIRYDFSVFEMEQGTELKQVTNKRLCRRNPPSGLQLIQIGDSKFNMMIESTVQNVLFDVFDGSTCCCHFDRFRQQLTCRIDSA